VGGGKDVSVSSCARAYILDFANLGTLAPVPPRTCLEAACSPISGINPRGNTSRADTPAVVRDTNDSIHPRWCAAVPRASRCFEEEARCEGQKTGCFEREMAKTVKEKVNAPDCVLGDVALHNSNINSSCHRGHPDSRGVARFKGHV
jgi:hypothetical protein